MYRPYKYKRGGSKNYRHFNFYRPRYACAHCRIACTSSKQLEQHLNGIKHKKTVQESPMEAEEGSFPLEHMVVLDQTEEDLPNDHAASPASCDSSDSETAASASDFQTIDDISRSHMVILDETNDDNDHPASPASCDSSASESAPTSPATVKTSDIIPRKKSQIEIPEDDQAATMSPSSCPSSSSAPEVEAGTSKKSTSKEHHANSSTAKHKESKKTFPIKPIKSNQDVFQFLKTFALANDSDVAFAEKVKEMFSNALRKYKEIELEQIFCTEAEHSSPEDLVGSADESNDHEQTDSLPQASAKSECERISSAPGSPTNSSPTQCISIPTSSADCKAELTTINQLDNLDTSSIALRSPTNKCEDMDISDTPSTANCTNDNWCSATEADLLDSENCVIAEAACSDDDV